jgi:uncharacterized membrane protein YkvA (DUF1232 family)
MNVKSLQQQAFQMKLYTLTIYYAAKDPDMPLLAKFLAIIVVSYALSPIDLIPDFIPIIGYLDDLIIIPLGFWLVLRLAPKHVIEAAKLKAEKSAEKPVSYLTAFVFILIWLISLGWFAFYFFGLLT